jgi:hypothetical protein
MRVVEGRGQVRPFRVPEVFLLVLPEDGAIVGDEGCYVQEGRAVLFDDGAGDDADVELGGKDAVGVEVCLVLGAKGGEFGVIGEP